MNPDNRFRTTVEDGYLYEKTEVKFEDGYLVAEIDVDRYTDLTLEQMQKISNALIKVYYEYAEEYETSIALIMPDDLVKFEHTFGIKIVGV